MYITVIKENDKYKELRSQNAGDTYLLIQVILVTVINALCWLPSGTIYTASVVMETYPVELLIWNAILINPLNSLLNPLIFCVMPIIKKTIARIQFTFKRLQINNEFQV